MQNEKNRNSGRSMKLKPVAVLLAVTLLVACAVSGTLAWLTDDETATNTFAIGKVDITLTETTGKDYQMVPGAAMDKDPVVTVKAGSEDCWVFLKVTETGAYHNSVGYAMDKYIAYKIDEANWTALEKDGEGKALENVYYCHAKDVTADLSIKVLGAGSVVYDEVTYSWGNQQVLTRPTVTEDMMEFLSDSSNNSRPELSFTAYAVQYQKNNTEHFTPEEAWAVLNPPSNP